MMEKFDMVAYAGLLCGMTKSQIWRVEQDKAQNWVVGGIQKPQRTHEDAPETQKSVKVIGEYQPEAE